MSSSAPVSGGGVRRTSRAVSARSTSAAIDATASSAPAKRKPTATIRRWRIMAGASPRVPSAPADEAEDGHEHTERADEAGDRADGLHQGDGVVGVAGRQTHAGEKGDSQHDHDEADNHKAPIRVALVSGVYLPVHGLSPLVDA